MGGVLQENDYILSYIGGSDLNFAGKGHFYSSHGFEHVEGLDELWPRQSNPLYWHEWGLYDDSLYNLARHRFDELAASEEVFGLFLLTLDSHHPNGYVSRSCKDMPYGDGSNSMLNSVHCADFLAANFINYIMEHEIFSQTMLVVASDHLALRNRSTDILNQGERRNLVMIFADDIQAGRVRRKGTILDIAPTLFNLLGYKTDGFGFGRDLLGPEPTLSELETPIEDVLREAVPFLLSLWQLRSFEKADAE